MREQVRVRWSNSEVLGDTWEDKASLQERFPLAEARGQASTQEEGDVNAPDRCIPPGNDTTLPSAAPREDRDRKPNCRTCGPEWSK